MEFQQLTVTKRDTAGKGPARRLRSQGKMPAVLYGAEQAPVSLIVDMRELDRVIRTSSTQQVFINLTIEKENADARTVMIKDLQVDPVSCGFLHADFYQIALDRKIRVMVPVVTTGQSKGVELGGILQVVRHELEIYCYPKHVPDAIEIDISELDVGESIHLSEIPLQEGIEIPAETNFTVVTVVSPTRPEEAEEEAEEAEAAEEEPVAEATDVE